MILKETREVLPNEILESIGASPSDQNCGSSSYTNIERQLIIDALTTYSFSSSSDISKSQRKQEKNIWSEEEMQKLHEGLSKYGKKGKPPFDRYLT